MSKFVFGLILVIVGIFVIISAKKLYKGGKAVRLGGIFGVLLGLFVVVTSFFTSISTGHTGVVTTFGKVEDFVLDAGINTKAPWQDVIEMDNRIQILDYDLSCFSSDIQEVAIKYMVNYQIDKANAQSIYKEVGVDYENKIVRPRVHSAVKGVIAKYTAETLVGNRATLADEIEKVLIEDAAKYNIRVVTTAIADIDFTDAFTDAVEAKQVAEQNKLRAETEQNQLTMEAKQAAERAKIQADADADVAKIQAKANAEIVTIQANADLEVQKINADAAEYTGQKEAAKNRAISESLTKELIQYLYTLQWNGELPKVTAGNNAGLLLDMSDMLNSETDK